MEKKEAPSWGKLWQMLRILLLGHEGLSRAEKDALERVLGGTDAVRSVIAPDSVFRRVDIDTFIWLVEHLGGAEQVQRVKSGELAILVQGRSMDKQRLTAPAPLTTVKIVVDRHLPVPCPSGMELLQDEQADVGGGQSQYDLLKQVRGWTPDQGKPPITAWGFRQALKKEKLLSGSLGFFDAIEIQKHGIEAFGQAFGQLDKVWFVRKVAMHEDGSFHAPCLSQGDGKLVFSWEPMTATLNSKVGVAIFKTK